MSEKNYKISANTDDSPIALTFRPVKDVITGRILFLDSFLMCNDEELGLMSPGGYFFAAENSERIETLNFIAIDLVAEALDRAKIDYDLDPSFSLLLSSRFLTCDEKFAELCAKLESMELPYGRIILTFSAVTLLRVGNSADTYLKILRKRGFRIAVTDFTVDTAEFNLLCDYHFDYLRIDADFVEDSYAYSRKNSAISMLRIYSEKESVALVANGVDHPDKIDAIRRAGIYAMSGAAIARGCSDIGKIFEKKVVDRDAYCQTIEKEEKGIVADYRNRPKDLEIGGEYADDYKKQSDYDEYDRNYDESAIDSPADDKNLITLSKSFTARLIQSGHKVGMFYTALKNAVHSYRNVISTVGWNFELISGRGSDYMRIAVADKNCLVVYYNLPVTEYFQSGDEDVTGDDIYGSTPLKIFVSDKEDLVRALKLAVNLLESKGATFFETQNVDYRLPYESTEELIARGLIKEYSSALPEKKAKKSKNIKIKSADVQNDKADESDISEEEVVAEDDDVVVEDLLVAPEEPVEADETIEEVVAEEISEEKQSGEAEETEESKQSDDEKTVNAEQVDEEQEPIATELSEEVEDSVESDDVVELVEITEIETVGETEEVVNIDDVTE